jgi:phage terminase Nu1 subunit (DNA packaging protein)
MTEKSNVVYIDNKEYKAEDLSQEQKYFIEQLTECQAEAHSLKKATDRIQIAQSHFMSLLKTSLANEETTKAMENSKAN